MRCIGLQFERDGICSPPTNLSPQHQWKDMKINSENAGIFQFTHTAEFCDEGSSSTSMIRFRVDSSNIL